MREIPDPPRAIGPALPLGLIYVLLGRIGVIGTAIATVLSQAVSAIVIPFFFIKTEGLF